MESADPVGWAQSQACVIKLQDWYHTAGTADFLGCKIADDNITLLFYIIFILQLKYNYLHLLIYIGDKFLLIDLLGGGRGYMFKEGWE